MEKIRLSIIVPVYNVEDFLEYCVKSVLQQSYKNLELILIDDGSTDSSGKLCDYFAHSDNRIKVIHQKNQGHTAARQAGLNVSTGHYIAFVDSDDWIEEMMFEKMLEKAQETDADIVQCNYRAVKADKVTEVYSQFLNGFYDKKMLINDIYPTLLYGGNYFFFGIAPNLWNKIFKKTLVIKYLYGIDHRIKIGEDGLFTYQCFLAAERVFILKDIFYNYRSREQSMCRVTDNTQIVQNHLLFKYYEELFKVYPFLRRQFHYYAVYLTLQAVAYMEQNMSLWEIRKKFRYLLKNGLEQESIKSIKIREVKGKLNKLRLLGLKL